MYPTGVCHPLLKFPSHSPPKVMEVLGGGGGGSKFFMFISKFLGLKILTRIFLVA